MHLGRFRFGMRTFKSSLAVLICILIFQLFDRGQPLIAALAAVFSLRQDLTSTYTFGKSRVIGNTIGGLAAIFYLLLQQYFSPNFVVELIALPILVALVITVSDGINNNAGIISAVATMLMITMSIPTGESVGYALARVLDTFIGTLIAIFLNAIIQPPETEKVQEIKDDLTLLKEEEASLEERLLEIQEQIKHENEKEK